MSHRRWQQNVAPGVSPRIRVRKSNESSKRATEISAAPTGLASLKNVVYPGLTPGPIGMPPADAGSLSCSPAISLLKRRLVSILGFFFLASSFGASFANAQSLI